MTFRSRESSLATLLVASALAISMCRTTLAQQRYYNGQAPANCCPPSCAATYGNATSGDGSLAGGPEAPFPDSPLDLGEAAPAQLGATFALAAPNFMGDFFGGAIGGGSSMPIDSIVVGSSGLVAPVPLSNQPGPYTYTDPNGGRGEFDLGGGTFTQLQSGPATFTTTISAAQFRNHLNNFPGTPVPTIPIVNNGLYQSLANSLLAARNNAAGTTVFRQQGSEIEGVFPTPVTDSDLMLVEAYYAYDYVVALNIPSPGSGGVVGIQKLVENGSPIPRDRLLFNYSMFNNVRFTPGGIDVNRFVFGFEKTFLDQTCSIELRAPFASTLSSDQILGSTGGTSTEFGNLTLYGKALLSSGETTAVGAGLGVALPTADNINVRDQSGTSLVQLRNQSVQLLPYIGGIYAPSEQFYSQAILQIDVVANGNDALVNAGNGLAKVGTLNDPTWLFASLNMGYWTYRTSPDERISGISPFIELHYNKTLNDTDAIDVGAVRLGNSFSNLEMINMVAGVNLELFGRSYVSVGYVAPVTTGSDRFFDGELRVQCNRYFW